jgi:hypothetical protein
MWAGRSDRVGDDVEGGSCRPQRGAGHGPPLVASLQGGKRGGASPSRRLAHRSALHTPPPSLGEAMAVQDLPDRRASPVLCSTSTSLAWRASTRSVSSPSTPITAPPKWGPGQADTPLDQ